MDLAIPAELFSPMQEVELDQHGYTCDLCTGFLDQLATRPHRTARREQIVNKQDLVPPHERVCMEFQTIGAVFKIVIHAVHHTGKFARLADWDEPRRERLCNRDPENESSAFSADDEVDPLAPVRVGHQFHREREGPRVREQRREILEYHAWLREIRDLFDQGIEFVVRFGALHETIIHAMSE